MTWDKFQRTVLPAAAGIEFLVPEERMYYSAILTAVNEDAPPIFQWDNEEQRNPFSWYVYVGMSMPAEWDLTPGPVDVTAICLQPSMWFSPEKARHQGESVILILNGAVDRREEGNAFSLKRSRPISTGFAPLSRYIPERQDRGKRRGFGVWLEIRKRTEDLAVGQADCLGRKR